ncbi:AraC family transcriptional regulator [Roseibium aquae]|nr:AraC family transcriptional regulator [Roseibium aquae]
MDRSKFWVRSDYLNFLRPHAATKDINWPKLLKDHGLTPESLCHPYSTVPASTFRSILETLCREIDNDAILFDIFHDVEAGPFCTWDYLFVYAPTLRAAIESIVQYGATRTNAIDFHFEETGEQGIFSWRFMDAVGPWRQSMYICAAIFVRRLERLLQMPTPPFRLEFATTAPKSTCRFISKYAGQLDFDALENRILLRKQLLDTENQTYEENLYSLIARAAALESERLLDQGPQLVRVAAQIKTNLRSGTCTLNGVAHDLNMSARALQRLLEQDGKSFRTMVETVRRSMAEHYIVESNRPLKEIAYLTGFSELSTFSRAVKGWFGISPRQLRDRKRPAPSPVETIEPFLRKT